MKKNNIVQTKSFAFAIRAVKLSKSASESMLSDAEELCKILGKIQITLKSRNSGDGGQA